MEITHQNQSPITIIPIFLSTFNLKGSWFGPWYGSRHGHVVKATLSPRGFPLHLPDYEHQEKIEKKMKKIEKNK